MLRTIYLYELKKLFRARVNMIALPQLLSDLFFLSYTLKVVEWVLKTRF